MKKVFVLLMIIAVSAVIFVGCTPEDSDTVTINIIMPDGAPALAMAKPIYDEFSYEGYDVNFKIAAGVQELKAGILDPKNPADIAILPTNLGANLYNQGIDLRLVSSNIFGLLYMLSSNELEDINDLKGKVVHNLGQGNTPDFVFKYILELNDIEYVEQDTPEEGKVALRYAANSQNLISMMVAGQVEYAILGEPQVSQAITETQEETPFQIVMNLQEEWTNGYPQVSTVARNDLIQNHSEFLDAFLQAVDDNTDWVVDNADDALAALTANGSNISGFDSQSIERCNINYVSSDDIKEDVMDYLQVMYEFNPMFVGGEMPDEGYFR